MKALSLWQPWASLMAAGYKRIETRDWPPSSLRQGQLVAIHAAKRWTGDVRELLEEDPFFKRYLTLAQRRELWDFTTPPLGAVIAVARFHSVIPTVTLIRNKQLTEREWAFGNFSHGRYGWVFSEVRPIQPIPTRGMQGLFNWQPPVEVSDLPYIEETNYIRSK